MNGSLIPIRLLKLGKIHVLKTKKEAKASFYETYIGCSNPVAEYIFF